MDNLLKLKNFRARKIQEMTIGKRESISFEFSINSDCLLNIKFHIGNKLVSNESIYTPTYANAFDKILEQLRTGKFKNENFHALSPTEIIKKIEEERDSNEQQFFKHRLQIDESTDQYSIYILEDCETTTFSWYCWDKNNCNSDHQINEIYTMEIPSSELISILELLIFELKNHN